jgi:hypothetical protein
MPLCYLLSWLKVQLQVVSYLVNWRYGHGPSLVMPASVQPGPLLKMMTLSATLLAVQAGFQLP